MKSSAAVATLSPIVYSGNSARLEVTPRQVDRHQAPPLPVTPSMMRCSRTLPPPPRATFSERSLAAVVVRSSITAITTISTPGTKLPPKSLATSALMTGFPRPGPLM